MDPQDPNQPKSQPSPNVAQPADRLGAQELQPGQTVQLPPAEPKRLPGTPLTPPKPPEADISQQQPVITPPIQTFPKLNLNPKAVPAGRLASLTAKQRKALYKLKNLRSHKHWHNAKIIIVTFLVFLLVFNSQWFISQFIYYFTRPAAPTTTQQTQTNQNTTTQTQPTTTTTVQTPQAEVVGPENLLIIPKLNVSTPIVYIDTIVEKDVLFALRSGIVHYAGTANPGENGNAVFFGHSSNDWWEPGNYKFVFVLLEKLVPGDTYEIHYNSRKYVYQVTETKVVSPNDLSVLNQTDTPTSTLITCTPPGTSWRRFIVFAKQTAPALTPTQVAPATPAPNPTASPSGATATLPSAPPSLWEQIIGFFSGLFGGNKPKPETNQPTTPAQPQHLPEVN